MNDTSDVYRFENVALICDETGDIIPLERADPSMISLLIGFDIVDYGAKGFAIEYESGNFAGIQFDYDGELVVDNADERAKNLADFLISMPVEFRKNFLNWMSYKE